MRGADTSRHLLQGGSRTRSCRPAGALTGAVPTGECSPCSVLGTGVDAVAAACRAQAGRRRMLGVARAAASDATAHEQTCQRAHPGGWPDPLFLLLPTSPASP